eukprot:TRINITY_DN5885_c0_g1_i4.p1 TRINITY_DN5885_c0_g1~~TRINITY_DN5885_c0_g1_i4.p1  ORF type:complete len:415 (-),score=84.02 TRINITY_DN5885_c0_g1_i4:67-1311(-)
MYIGRTHSVDVASSAPMTTMISGHHRSRSKSSEKPPPFIKPAFPYLAGNNVSSGPLCLDDNSNINDSDTVAPASSLVSGSPTLVNATNNTITNNSTSNSVSNSPSNSSIPSNNNGENGSHSTRSAPDSPSKEPKTITLKNLRSLAARNRSPHSTRDRSTSDTDKQSPPIVNKQIKKLDIEVSPATISLGQAKSETKDTFSEVTENPTEASVFGVSLEELSQRENSTIPLWIQNAVDYLDHYGLSTIGLFRIDGTKETVGALRALIDKGGSVDFSGSKPHAVGTLIKQFLRSLPKPLISEEYFKQFCDTADLEETSAVEKIRELVSALPQANFSLLDHLVSFCTRVVARSDENKMNADNLASLLAPNILYKRENNTDNPLTTVLNDVQRAIKVVRIMITHYTLLFIKTEPNNTVS